VVLTIFILYWTALEIKLLLLLIFVVIAPIFIVKLPREKTIKVGSTLLFNCLIEEKKLQEYLVGVDILPKG